MARRKALSKGSKNYERKHPCRDCGFCQWCSDTRCDSCRGKRSNFAGMSFEEQIAIFEKINNRPRAQNARGKA